MAQLDLGAQPDVSSQETDERRPGQRTQLLNHAMNAWQHGAIEFPEQMMEKKYVAVEEALEVIGCGRDVMLLKEVPDNRRIGAARELEPRGAVEHAELGFAHAAKGFLACAPALNQRPVDVEQNHTNHKGGNSR